jgi:hypothetical protein
VNRPSKYRKFNGVQFELFCVNKYKKDANYNARLLKKQLGGTRIRIVPANYKNSKWAVYVNN